MRKFISENNPEKSVYLIKPNVEKIFIKKEEKKAKKKRFQKEDPVDPLEKRIV